MERGRRVPPTRRSGSFVRRLLGHERGNPGHRQGHDLTGHRASPRPDHADARWRVRVTTGTYPGARLALAASSVARLEADERDTVGFEGAVGGHDREPVDLRLGDQDPVEGIAVMEGKFRELERVFMRDG